ncbi:MAG: helix-turn-helix domain-containing protein [Ferruginibacter sp.]
MSNQLNHLMHDHANGNPAINLFKFEENFFSGEVQRNNYFSIIWIKEGFGKVKAGFLEVDFEDNSMFTFAPNQPYLFITENPIKGIVINFQTEFIFADLYGKGQRFKELLYNNFNQPPFIKINAHSIAAFDVLSDKIEKEIQDTSLAQHDLLVAYLRIFLINASRLKIEQQPQSTSDINGKKEHYILQKLNNFIEEHFKAKHSPSDYAAMLYVTPKTLGKVSKSYYNRTISSIINERIIVEAKRELYLTNKAIKEIAYELGYEDEYYFSRFFKINAKLSPQKYRETVAVARA